MKRLASLPLAMVFLAIACNDVQDVKKSAPADPITAPVVAASPLSITSSTITVSEAGKASTVCGVYLAELDKAHASLQAAPTSDDATRQVQLFAKLATDACN
ncbi:MAG TPA: hypothetical protein VFQ38_02760 [Longimicrobiales bacterium]|nr:hypothetical protein [Longimicrobiales bacterium]